MKISHTMLSSYPKTSAFLATHMPSVRRKKNFVKTFCEYSGASAKTVRRAFDPDGEPVLGTKPMLSSILGKFHPKEGEHNIWINKLLCDHYEHDQLGQSESTRLVIEATVVHEIVHWADYLDGEYLDEYDDHQNDQGMQFQRAFYGHVPTPQWLSYPWKFEE